MASKTFLMGFLVLTALILVAVGAPQARYPPGVNPAACPYYPYCNPAAGLAGTLGYPYGYPNNEYPAAVNPAACPNYPYC